MRLRFSFLLLIIFFFPMACLAVDSSQTGSPDLTKIEKQFPSFVHSMNNIKAQKGYPQNYTPQNATPFFKALILVKTYYVKPLHTKQLIAKALKGVRHAQDFKNNKKLTQSAMHALLQGLDPHSLYLTPEQYTLFLQSIDGAFGGLGIRIFPYHNGLKILGFLATSPGQKAGLKIGDIIVRVNNKRLKNMRLNHAISLLRGKAKSLVKVTVLRKTKTLNFSILRQVIRINPVKATIKNHDYAYIKIRSFSQGVTQKVLMAFNLLKQAHKGPFKGLILDLRNNPGGLLQEAVHLADSFLNKGHIVSVEQRFSGGNKMWSATLGDVTHGLPIAVLINGNSASAAEILAGALTQDKRAISFGTKSYGKYSVQNIFNLGKEGAVKLTIAQYHTPNGHTVKGGLIPQIKVKDDPKTKKDEVIQRAISTLAP